MISPMRFFRDHRLAIGGLLCLVVNVLAESSAVDEARELGARGNAAAAAAARTPPPSLPGYEGSSAQTRYFEAGASLKADGESASERSVVGPIVESRAHLPANAEAMSPIRTREMEAERDGPLLVGSIHCGYGECKPASNVSAQGTAEQMSEASTWLHDAQNAADDMDGRDGSSSVAFFRGKAQKCKDEALGFSNCCSDRGWGLEAGLARCDAEEQELGLAKQAGRTHYVGHYSTGTLVETRHKSYCTFASILSRLVQEQGRAQLGIGWGSAKDPDCRPLSPAEMASLDLARMDLREFHGRAKAIAEAAMRSRPSADTLGAGVGTAIAAERARAGTSR